MKKAVEICSICTLSYFGGLWIGRQHQLITVLYGGNCDLKLICQAKIELV